MLNPWEEVGRLPSVWIGMEVWRGRRLESENGYLREKVGHGKRVAFR
ncbi:hypothetical protein KKJ09_12635 [Xenorhabdus bovienii]|nr:hypothetical protein [Xenorhabdus bovienii]MDE9494408.1 hypothetical protein [Xenorhabdus bovienii]MDE9502847.1 hypothetical protein [Xenorhabdus bovienii]MDE9526462.1 hypothetical protein [Xenorhabdus bovienii]